MTIPDKAVEAALDAWFGRKPWRTIGGHYKDMMRAALAAAEQAMWEPQKCRWQYDDRDEAWATSCGHMYMIIDGTPADNGMEFCCYCGGSLSETKK